MGRPSSTGLPYLIPRSPKGAYNYHRDLPAEIAPLIAGEVFLPWVGRNRALTGKATVKVSLGTGDKKTAQQRWAAVHPQVDALVRLAEVAARHARQSAKAATPQVEGPPDAQVEAPRLDPARVRVMAGQAYHDVLASQDRCHVEVGHLTPVADLLLQLGSRASGAARAPDLDGELAERLIERRLHEQRLRTRTTHRLDFTIEEGEVDDPALASVVQGLKPGGRLAPEQLEALACGIRVGDIAGEVEERLRENGIELPPDHVDRRALALAITRAKLRGLEDARRRDAGRPIETPERPVCSRPAAESPPSVPLLSEMPARWITAVQPLRKQVDDLARYVRLFIGLHGDLPVDRITGAHVRAFRDRLLECPRNVPRPMAGASIAELVTWAKARPNAQRLGRRTVNEKGVGTIGTLLGQAMLEEHVRSNVARNQKLRVKDEDRQQRRSYRPDELNHLSRSRIYQARPVIPMAGGGWAAWWLPLLGLYTGARLEELGQALVGDVRREGGIDFLMITTLDETGEGAEGTGKSLKSGAAQRRIPLHRKLLDLGFLDYVATLAQGGLTRLFPGLPERGGRYTAQWSRWWGRWLDGLGLSDPCLTYHSFRHTFVAELRRLKCHTSIMKSLVGHAQSDVTSGYGRINGSLHELPDLDAELQRIVFPGLDLDHLLELRPWQ